MFFNLIQSGISFVQTNIFLVAMLMSIVAYVRIFISNYPWAKGWMITAIAFALAFLFAIPPQGLALTPDFIIQGFMLGLTATGIYKTGAAIAEKAKDL